MISKPAQERGSAMGSFLNMNRLCLVLALTIGLVVALSACGDGESPAPEATRGGLTTDNTVGPAAIGDPDEVAAAEEMMRVALADGEITIAELEAFALESVECVKRAGFTSDLQEFRSDGSAIFVTGAEREEDRDTAELAGDRCHEIYYLQAHIVYGDMLGESQEEYEEAERRRIIAAIECYEAAGYEVDDPFTAFAESSIPVDVVSDCTEILVG